MPHDPYIVTITLLSSPGISRKFRLQLVIPAQTIRVHSLHDLASLIVFLQV